VDVPLQQSAPAPRRRCRCGEPAPCVRIWRSASFLTVGNRYEHTCARCNASFSVHDTSRLLSALFAAAALSCVAAFIVAHPPGAAIGADTDNRRYGLALLAVGALGWVRLVLLIRGRFIHPAT
jgi:hypothetical protein